MKATYATRALRYGLAMETVGQFRAFRGLYLAAENQGEADAIDAQIQMAEENAAAMLHDLLAALNPPGPSIALDEGKV